MKKIYKTDPALIEILVNVKLTIRDAQSGKVKRIKDYHNLVVSASKNLIAEFIGNTTPTTQLTLSPNFCAVGTGTGSPSAADVQLQTETSRTNIASKSSSTNVAYITGYFGAADAVGTLRECGLFIGGTATVNTGTLFDRVSINITKSGSETLTLDFTITIS